MLARLELEEQGRNYKEEHAEINAKTAEYYKELKKQTDEIIKQKNSNRRQREAHYRVSLRRGIKFYGATNK